MKNCVFQYATSDGTIYKDTDLITRDEADALWEETTPDFIDKMEKGMGPEMALWIDMDSSFNYRTTAKHWHADDLILIDGELYEKVRVS